jgi:hypothetical protein
VAVYFRNLKLGFNWLWERHISKIKLLFILINPQLYLFIFRDLVVGIIIRTHIRLEHLILLQDPRDNKLIRFLSSFPLHHATNLREGLSYSFFLVNFLQGVGLYNLFEPRLAVFCLLMVEVVTQVEFDQSWVHVLLLEELLLVHKLLQLLQTLS